MKFTFEVLATIWVDIFCKQVYVYGALNDARLLENVDVIN